VISGDLGVISGVLSVISGVLGVISGDLGVISGDLGVISGDLGVISGDLGVISEGNSRDYVERVSSSDPVPPRNGWDFFIPSSLAGLRGRAPFQKHLNLY